MIGLPSTYRAGQRPPPPPDPNNDYSTFLRQAEASGLPSSTRPSASHSRVGPGSQLGAGRSLEQHPSALTLDSANFGVLEPQAPAGRSYSSFAPLLGRPTPQQQIPGDFVPGSGGGTTEYYRNRAARPHVQIQVRPDRAPIHAQLTLCALSYDSHSTMCHGATRTGLGTLTGPRLRTSRPCTRPRPAPFHKTTPLRPAPTTRDMHT